MEGLLVTYVPTQGKNHMNVIYVNSLSPYEETSFCTCELTQGRGHTNVNCAKSISLRGVALSHISVLILEKRLTLVKCVIKVLLRVEDLLVTAAHIQGKSHLNVIYANRLSL
jgi:hypothetical protein